MDRINVLHALLHPSPIVPVQVVMVLLAMHVQLIMDWLPTNVSNVHPIVLPVQPAPTVVPVHLDTS